MDEATFDELPNGRNPASDGWFVLQVVRENGSVQLEVSDNGTGIADANNRNASSSGLSGLAQRALVLGGEAKATRLDTGGTRVVFRVPVNGRRDTGAHPR